MRIAFVGKGGSGKTTLSALFALFLTKQNKQVIVVDADINQHLGENIGFTEDKVDKQNILEKNRDVLLSHIKGDNKLIESEKYIMKTTPPGSGSGLVYFNSPILDKISTKNKNLRLIQAGQLTDKDVGINCFHGKITTIEILLNHLVDKNDEYFIVDMTAGADWFSSGLFTKFDKTFLIIEPTKKSLDIFKQFKDRSSKYGVEIDVIANKIENDEDLEYIISSTNQKPIAVINKMKSISKLEREYNQENLDLIDFTEFNKLLKIINQTNRNRKKMYDDNIHFHKLSCETWMNKRVGKDLLSQIDNNFDPNRLL